MIQIEDEPDGDSAAPHHFYIGIGIAVFGFASVWRYYPRSGAILSLVGTLLALDDVIEHTANIPTPVDELWQRVIYPIVAKIES